MCVYTALPVRRWRWRSARVVGILKELVALEISPIQEHQEVEKAKLFHVMDSQWLKLMRIKIILREVTKLSPQLIPLDKCSGHIISEDIIAKDPFPAFPTSMMDGYAVSAPLVAGSYKMQNRILAGDDAPILDRGINLYFMWIYLII